MRVGESLMCLIMVIVCSMVAMAQDDQDLQGRVQYEKKESKPTVKSNPSKPEMVEGEMELSPEMTRIFEYNLSDPDLEVDVLNVLEDRDFLQSLSGQNEMPEEFEYKDDKFVLKYERSGDEEKIKADGDPTEFVAKYNAYQQQQATTPQMSSSGEEGLYAEPMEIGTSTRGIDAKTRARNYAPVQDHIISIDVPVEETESCPMNNDMHRSTMKQKGKKMGGRSCPGHSSHKGSSSSEEYHYNSSGQEMNNKEIVHPLK
jgi:hypothetical protein